MPKVIPVSRLLKKLTDQERDDWVERPPGMPRPSEMKREDCKYGPRPCPLVSCRHNNYLSDTDVGTIILTWPDKQPEDVDPRYSCALDVSERGQTAEKPMTFRELATVLDMTYQAIQQLVAVAQKKGRYARRSEGWNDDGE